MSALSWVKPALVISWNGYSCYRAYKDFKELDSASPAYWQEFRTYLLKYNPLFVKIAAATPPAWDDEIFNGIAGALSSEVLWNVVVTTLKQYKQQADKDKEKEANPPIIQRRRILQRLFVRNIGSTSYVLPAEDAEILQKNEAGFGITEILLILSIINSSGNVWKFIIEIAQWFRDVREARRLKRNSRYDIGEED